MEKTRFLYASKSSRNASRSPRWQPATSSRSEPSSTMERLFLTLDAAPRNFFPEIFGSETEHRIDALLGTSAGERGSEAARQPRRLPDRARATAASGHFRRRAALFLFQFPFQLRPCPEQQHPQIIPLHAELLAHLLDRPFVQENGRQKLPVARRDARKDVPHPLAALAADQPLFGILARIRPFRRIWNERRAGPGPGPFQQHVVAHGVDERSNAFRLPHGLLPQRLEHAQKRLLPEIVDHVRRQTAGAQLDIDELSKIAVKMLLCCRVAGSQPFQVTRIEMEEVHACACTGSSSISPDTVVRLTFAASGRVR